MYILAISGEGASAPHAAKASPQKAFQLAIKHINSTPAPNYASEICANIAHKQKTSRLL